MIAPKRHHTIPKFLLRNFADKDGLVHFFDRKRPNLGIQSATPLNVSVIKHYFAETDRFGTRDVAAESVFSRVESAAAPIVSRIIESARSPTSGFGALDPRDESVLHIFYYFQMKRSPEFFAENAKDILTAAGIERFLSEYERTVRPLTDSERAEFRDPSVVARLHENVRVRAMSRPSPNASEILAIFGTKKLQILSLRDTRRGFAIGTRSVAKLQAPGRPHLGDAATSLYMPVAKDVALNLTGEPGVPSFLQLRDMSTIRQLNNSIAQQSNLIAAASRKLVESLVAPR